MGHRRRRGRDTYSGDRNERYDRYDEPRDRRDRDRGDRDPYSSSRRYDRDDRDRDYYGRDRDWRDRRSPPPSRGRYSPEYRRRRSYSRSPPRGSSPSRARDYDAPSTSAAPPASNGAAEPRW